MVKNYIQKSKVNIIDWPAQSPDVNPNENLCVELKDQGPWQETIKSRGAWEFCQRRICWDSSGDVSDTYWKLQQAVLSSKKNTKLSISIRANDFDPG